MFENSNKGMIKEIAEETMKVHHLRNTMACFAIALTAILITLICGAGISTVKALMTEREMNPGPGTHGAAIVGNLQTLEMVRKQPEVEFADIARPCMNGTPHNKEFIGNTIKFMGVNNGYYEHHYVDLLSGEYPQNATEVLMSDTLASKTGRNMVPGQRMTLNLMVVRNGEETEEPVEVTVSGFYNNPLRAIENYEELYTTEDFPDIYNPQLEDENSRIYTKIKGVTSRTPDLELYEKLEKINKAADGEGSVYIYATNLTSQYAGGAAILLLIIASGYFLIYNIFYISVVNDIRFMGSMKTIGMTGKQIRGMLGYQVRRLGILGILIGVVAGTIINLLVIKLLGSMNFTFARYYEGGAALIIAALAAIVFSAITVWISSRKAVSLAAKVSPVEASRFGTSGKRKTVFAVISYTLSGILFCALSTALLGYDVEHGVNRMNGTEFNVRQSHAEQYMEGNYQPLSIQVKEEIEKLPFIKDSYTYYKARNLYGNSKIETNSESLAAVKFEGTLKKVMEEEFQNTGTSITESSILDLDNNMITGILGVNPKALMAEKENLDILSGSLDAEKFASGDYIIYQPFYGWGKGNDYPYGNLKANDKLPVTFFNYKTGIYETREFTVMAVTAGKADNYAGVMSNSTMQLIIPDSVFKSIYKEDADKMISNICFNTSGDNKKEQQEILDDIISKSFNTELEIGSKYKTRIYEEKQKLQQTGIGLFVGIIFGFIGIANVVNTLVTGVLSRKLEYAALQSVGMTKNQMIGSIFKDGMKIIGLSAVLMTIVGVPAANAVAVLPLSTGFVPWLYAASAAGVVLIGVLLTFSIAFTLTQKLNKKSVVERLRDIE